MVNKIRKYVVVVDSQSQQVKFGRATLWLKVPMEGGLLTVEMNVIMSSLFSK